MDKTEQAIILKDIELLKRDLKLWTLGMMISGFVLVAGFITYMDSRTQSRLDRMEQAWDTRLDRIEQVLDTRLRRVKRNKKQECPALTTTKPHKNNLPTNTPFFK